MKNKIVILSKKLLSIVLVASIIISPSCNVDVPAADINNIGAPEYRIQKNMEGTDAFVYAYNVMDYGADNTGNNDNTTIFQKLIDKTSNLGGGIIYIPAGRYKVTGSLRIKKGVTLRGDWVKPVPGQNITSGTILMAYIGRGQGEKSTPFMETETEVGIKDMTIWYPEQDPNNIVQYSPTIRLGCNGYWGNEYANIKNVTLVNSYIGVWWNQDNGGAAPVINGLYGTPLKKGIEIDCLVDVGRIENVNFSPDYWMGSGFSNSPAKDGAFENWLYENGIGFIMRRNDWSYACYINIDGYNIGFNTKVSTEGNGSTPNGHHYKFNLRNCKTGILFETSNSVGIMFNDVVAYNCETGVKVNGGTSDVIQFSKGRFTCKKYAINMDKASSTRFLIYDTVIEKGVVNIDGGTFMSTGNTYNNKTPQIVIGSMGRVSLAGNKFTNPRTILNNSIYKSELDNPDVSVNSVPDFPDEKSQYQSHMPSKLDLYVVTQAPYYANNVANHGGGNDCTNAIQNAINDAAANGGGIVFLPAGHYRVNGHLTIPSNVELRGATDLSTVPHGSGAIIEAYENKGNPNGAPLISIAPNAGVRGVIINYPEQTYKLDGNGEYHPIDYPITMQGQGENVYVINVGIRAGTFGLDLDTYRCDNHYVDFLTGHSNKITVKVGNGSKNGIINNLMFNCIVYGCGQEYPKFGGFPNSPNLNAGESNGPVGEQQMREMQFLVVGDTENQTLYNCFTYGGYTGAKMINERTGGPQNLICMGLGIDAARKSVYFANGLTHNMDFINTQLVTLNNDQPITRYYEAEANSNFTANMYNSDLWGSPEKGLVMGENSGTLNLYSANFQQRGYNGALTVGNGTRLNLITSNLNSNNAQFSVGSNNISLIGTVADYTANEGNQFVQNVGNFSSIVEINGNSQAVSAIDRSSWTATSNVNNNLAQQTLDGDLNSSWNSSWQAPGQWFEVDMKQNVSFDTIVTTLGAYNDTPGQYKVLVSNDGNNWREVASGQNQNVYSVGEQNARYIRIEQSSSAGKFWAIFEFYVLKSATYDPGEGEWIDPEEPEQKKSDLVITDIYTKDKYYEGDEAVFVAKIKNNGQAATPSGVKHGLALSVDGTVVNWCDTYFGPMQPGEEVELIMNGGPNDKDSWTVVQGTYTVSAMIDDQSLISESIEDNNTFEKTITFGVKPVEETRENLALSKISNASGNEEGEWYSENAFDGDIGTRWSSNYSDDAWILVDLGKRYIVDKVVLNWEAAYGEEYNIEVSTDGNNWITVANLVDQDGDEDVITFNPTDARYVKMQGVKRALPYGYSLWEMKVYGEDSGMEEPTTEEPTTEEPTTTPEEEKPVIISDKLKIEGYQISYLLKGLRIVSSVEPVIDGKKVVRTGNIYGVASAGVTASDLVLGSNNKFVANFDATNAGLINQQMGESSTANYYAMTMIGNGTGADDYNREYVVRAYAVMEDGTIMYSQAVEYTIYKVASFLYKNNLMTNYSGHSYLYNDILKVVEPDFEEVKYKWGNILVKVA